MSLSPPLPTERTTASPCAQTSKKSFAAAALEPLEPPSVARGARAGYDSVSPPSAPASAGQASAAKTQSAAALREVARALREKAEFALVSVRDEAKRLAIVEDSRRPKPTTEPGRLLRRAEHASARAEAEARKEAERAEKARERVRKEVEKRAERARKEAARLAEKAKKEKEKEEAALAKRAAEEARLAERAAQEETRLAEKAKKEEARLAEKAKKEAEREAERAKKVAQEEARLAEKAEKEAARLAEKAKKEEEKEKARLAREAALTEARALREAAEETSRATKEAERKKREALRAETESALVADLVRFLLRHPRLNKETAAAKFAETKLAELPDEKKAFATKAFARANVPLVAEAPANPADPLRRWRITPRGLASAGLTPAEAEALRPAVALTAEERALVEKRRREAARRAEETKREALKKKQASVLKGFFAAAPKKTALRGPEPAVFAAPRPKAPDAEAERAFVEAVCGSAIGGDDDDDTAARSLVSEHARRWKAKRSATLFGEDATATPRRWGARRGAKRTRSGADATLNMSASPGRALGERSAEDAATRLAIERSLADVEASRENLAAGSFPSERVAKRRKLISVDCSSEYRADEALADGAAGSGGGVGQSQSLQYRFGFQLGLEQLDSRAELRKTFPVPGGRPAFWGSHGRIVPSPRADVPASSAREKVSGRRPFARDARATYVDDAGVAFDSGDEWDEPEDGERLDGSDEDDEDDEGALSSWRDGQKSETDDEHEEGFVVPDGYLSAEENARGGEDDLADDEMDVDGEADDERGGFRTDGDSRDGTNAASEEREEVARAERASAQLTQRMHRARRQNRPLVIVSFARDARPAPATPEREPPEPRTAAAPDPHAPLLAALASSRVWRGGKARGSPVVSLYVPPPSAEELFARDAARAAEEKRAREAERARAAAAKAEEKRRREEERERARLAREAAAAAAADERAKREEERLAKKAEKEAAAAAAADERAKREEERLAKKAEKEAAKAARAAEKAAKAATKKNAAVPTKGGAAAATPAKSLFLASETETPAKGAKVSPIKSLFERAEAAKSKSAAGDSVAATPE